MAKDGRSELAGKIGRTLRRYRLLQDRTQLDVANAIGNSQPTYSQWERGQTLPTFDVIVRLLAELDIPGEEILPLLDDGDTNGDDKEAA